MPKNSQLSAAAVNVQADALAAMLNDGYLCIFTGSQPASADSPLKGTLLAKLRFDAVAAQQSSDGRVQFKALKTAEAIATGEAGWFRAYRSDGETAVLDGTVDIHGGGANIELNTTQIARGAKVSIDKFAHSVPKASR